MLTIFHTGISSRTVFTGIVFGICLLAVACDSGDADGEVDSPVAMDMSSTDMVMDGGSLVSIEGEITASDIRGGQKTFLHQLADRTAPGFTLTDQHGDRVNLSDYRGKWVVMDWIYTNCMTVCPSLTHEMMEVRDALGDRIGTRLELISVTFDAERDGVETMRKHAENVTGNAQGWAWLTGTQKETDAVARAYGLAYADAPAMMGVPMFDHTALTVVIDPDGRERHQYFGVGWGEDMATLLDELVSPPPPEPSASIGQNISLVSDTKVFNWADWELDPGITVQTLRVFPDSDTADGFFTETIEGMVSSGWLSLGDEDAEGTLKGTYTLYRHPDGRHAGVGYNLNVMVQVEGKSDESTRDTLIWMAGGYCC